jgi:hypothetical protein
MKQAREADKEYAVDISLGPRGDQLERAFAVDYARHGIDLRQRPEEELASTFQHRKQPGSTI